MAAILWAAFGQMAGAQATAAKRLEFDVASVKQNKSDEKPRSTFSLDNGNIYSTVEKGADFAPKGSYFSAKNEPLWHYISFAYNLSGTQELALRFSYFSGLSAKLPEWVTGGTDSSGERFDIEARSAAKPTKDEMRQMMQSLLEDRFKLVVHHETRQAPVFALVLAKLGVMGPRLQAHPAGDACLEAEATASATAQLPVVCGVIAHLVPSGPGLIHVGGRGVSLSLLASSLPTMTGMAMLPRRVVDETGLSGLFDFSLEWLPELNPPPDASGLTFREALKEQMGLTLEPKKGPVDILVIDHVEQPSAN
jgi:uncharacterized protein (TIGR03435 family)